MKKLLIVFCVLGIYKANAQTDVPGKTNQPAVQWADSSSKGLHIEAQFPGGAQGWMHYLQRNLRAQVAGDNIVLKRRQKDSTETILVSFLVDTLGNISEVKVENQNPVTPAVAAEAKRVIEKGPKWNPATIDGKPVIFRQRQSLSFYVSKG